MASTTDDLDLVSLREAAEVLGVHRATVNDMVLSRRLRARRRRGHWYVERSELERFAAGYTRPPNAPPSRGQRRVSPAGYEVLALLLEWGDATVAELDRVVDLHEGNIRKQLRLLAAEGLTARSDDGHWVPTELARAETSPVPATV